MTDKSWMLNPKAIRRAKECIQIIRDLEGVKLKLSHPDFVQQLHQYVESTRSAKLGEAYANLIAMAGVGHVVQSLRPKAEAFEGNMPYLRAVGDALGR